MDAKKQETGRKIFWHELPPWIDPDASEFFITICCRPRGSNQLCLPEIGPALLRSAQFYTDQRKWVPSIFLLMPDHLHMIVSFGYEHAMAKMAAGWKRYTARQHGILWQDGFFEHRLRGDESWEEKAAYSLRNPVRAGLVREDDEWPFLLKTNWLA